MVWASFEQYLEANSQRADEYDDRQRHDNTAKAWVGVVHVNGSRQSSKHQHEDHKDDRQRRNGDT
jgi:hypothetical protein